MYSLYIPKYKKKPGSSSILPKMLGHFMKCTQYSYDLLVSPGYLSRTDETIEKFLMKIEKNLAAGGPRSVGLGLFYGMNGYNNVTRGTKGNPDILSAHNNVLKNNCSQLKKIAVAPGKRKDHRKMVFFFKRGSWKIRDTLNSENYRVFLNSIEVKAVLIGSSNFSWSTYYDAETGTPAKGEADLLMFVDKSFKYYLLESGQLSEISEMVLFESIAGGENPEEFFKNILRDFLENSLR